MSKNLPSYVIISQDINQDLHAAVERLHPDKIAILIDENTKKYCLPFLEVPTDVIIEIQSGEQHKTLDTCKYIWDALTKGGFTRKSLLINLGGGVIGDMGGFAAATFKRGMHFINIPTTLLAQVDASVGGKLGVDFHGLKNHIGTFQDPTAVLVFTKFLETLPERELKSGFAEVIKHALIQNQDQWTYLQQHTIQQVDWNDLIPKSIGIKQEVVTQDPREMGLRKILNYGHTIGHAIESHFLKSNAPLLHGEAIAWGMLLENDLAVQLGMLDEKVSEEISSYLRGIYDLPGETPDFHQLASHLLQDKKNDAQGIRFSLLKNIGACAHDVLVEEQLLKKILK